MPSASPRELSTLLDHLAAGRRPSSAELTLLSDLGKDETALVGAAWGAIPLESRSSLLSRASELAEDNVDLDFSAVAAIGLDDEHPEVRALAADALWEATDRDLAARLRARLDDEDSAVRAASARALRQFVILTEFEEVDMAEGEAVVEALRARASDPMEETIVRASALESLGSRSLPWVGPLIQEAFDSDERELRIGAMHAMGDSGEERWLDYLYELLYADDAELRFEAVTAIGAIGSEEAVATIAELLDDDDSEVAMAAVEALGEIGGDVAAERLEEYAPRSPDFMAELVAVALDAARGGFGIDFGAIDDEDDE